MATDFAVCLQRFLTSHLAGLRGCSPNTIASYRDTFKLLIVFFGDVRSIPPDRLTLDHIDAAAITGFLDWLETERHNSISTRNQRLAGLSSFFRWLQSQDPARMAGCQDILAVPAKKTAQPGVNHLAVEQARRLLAAPDRSTRRGRRDATLLATLYDSAARASELAGLTVGDIRVQPPPLAVLAGKGRKIRHVPLGGNTAALLSAYLAEHGLNRPGHDDHPLFVNQHGNKLSRGGIAWIIGKYQAQAGDPALAGAALSPHVLRHSRAMHRCRRPLPYIGATRASRRTSAGSFGLPRGGARPEALQVVTDECLAGPPGLLERASPACWATANGQASGGGRICDSGHERCARSGPHQARQASAAHNPALLIRRGVSPRHVQRLPAPAGPGMGRGDGVLVRFADDLVVMCWSRSQAERALERLTALLAGLGLEPKAAKTRIVHLEVGGEGFDFLGFHHRLVRSRGLNGNKPVTFLARWPADKAMQHARDRIRELTGRSWLLLSPEWIVEDLNRFLRGWAAYFRFGNSRPASRRSGTTRGCGWRCSSAKRTAGPGSSAGRWSPSSPRTSSG